MSHRIGSRTMEPAIAALERRYLPGRLAHGHNPALTWCMGNVVASRDHHENRRFDKARSRERIDLAVALALAVSCAEMNPKPPQSIYETRGPLVLL